MSEDGMLMVIVITMSVRTKWRIDVADDFDKGPLGQDKQQFDDIAHQQGQGQTQSGVPGSSTEPLGADNDTGTEAVTGNTPQSGAGDETTDNAGTEDFAAPHEGHVEEVELDRSTESAAVSEPRKSEIDLDDEDDEASSDAVEDKDGDGI
jgi:hypothetical protein